MLPTKAITLKAIRQEINAANREQDERLMKRIDDANREQDERLMKYIRHEIDEAVSASETRIRAEISHLPTKQEFFERMDQLALELKMIRQELPALSHRVAIHDEQIQKLASHVSLAL